MAEKECRKERKVEKLDFQYKLQFIVIFISIVVCVAAICVTCSLKNEVESLTDLNEDLIAQTKELNADMLLLIEENLSDEAFEEFIEKRSEKTLEYPDEPATLKDTIELMDRRYDDFTDNWSNILLFVSAGLGILVIIIPFFNYLFLQKDAVKKYEKKMRKLHNKKEDEMSEIIDSFDCRFREDEKELKKSHKEMKKEIEISFNSAKDANRQIEKSQKKLEKSTKEIDKKIEEWKGIINKAVENAKIEIDNKLELANKTIDMTNQYVESVSNLDENRKAKDIDVEFEDAKDRARVHSLNGRVSIITKDFDKAIEHYSKAIEIDSTNADAYFFRAYSYTEKNDPNYAESIEDLTNVVKLEPNNAIAYNNLACSYIELSKKENAKNNLKEAYKNIEKSLELDESEAFTYCTLAEYYYEMGPKYRQQQKEAHKKAVEFGRDCSEDCRKCDF